MNISQLVAPIGPTVSESEPMTHVAKLLTNNDRGFVTVVQDGPKVNPRGFITHGDLAKVKLKHPQQWPLMKCRSVLAGRPQSHLRDEDAIEQAVELLKREGVRPLLIFTSSKLLGVLEPAKVFNWCAEHSPSALEELAYLVSQEERNQYPVG